MKKEKKFASNEDSPSRSMKKRESTALQKLGEELAALPMGTLRSFPIPEDILNAVADWQKMKDHEAKRRQMQYIGRLMRENDVQELAAQYTAWKEKGMAATAVQHELEELREQLLQGQTHAAAIVEKFPHMDLAHLDALVKQAQQERAKQAPPKAFRALFRYLRDFS